MTQSDAPNEGRENKTAVDFLIEFSPTPKAGYEDTWILRSMEAYKRQETESLRDQLSKEREINKNLHKAMTTAEQRGVEKGLEEGGEMRKDFAEMLHECSNYFRQRANKGKKAKRIGAMLNEAESKIMEARIASELDKNKT